MSYHVNWMPWGGQGSSLQPQGKHWNGTSTQQSGLLSGFNVADLGCFPGLFLQEKQQLSCWEAEQLVFRAGGLCLGDVTLHFASSLGGYLLPVCVFNNMFTVSISRKKILLVFIFLLRCFCITNGTNWLHILAELTSVAGSPPGPAGNQHSLCRLYFSNTSATLEIKHLLIMWNNAWHCEHTKCVIPWWWDTGRDRYLGQCCGILCCFFL